MLEGAISSLELFMFTELSRFLLKTGSKKSARGINIRMELPAEFLSSERFSLRTGSHNR